MTTTRSRRKPRLASALGLLLLSLCCRATNVHAGGGAEHAILIIPPDDPAAIYLGHYYRHARAIPESHVVYMSPAGANFATHVAYQNAAIAAVIAQRGLTGQIDYIIVAPCAQFFVPAPGLVTDGCAPVTRFALSSAYTLAHIAPQVLAGGLPSSYVNQYYSAGTQALAFDSDSRWAGGSVTGNPSAPRYYIGMQLGYLGERGNSVAELVDMIDRSVAADGARPAGTFYFMRTPDPFRSPPRDPFFAAVITALSTLAGSGILIDAVLPVGATQALGVMTGWADPDIAGTDMTLIEGAFCDHLTSYAATFDTASQTKLSRWIAKGASGSHGAVEEPCNYAGKFPHPRVHHYYFQGAALGEAVLRSLQYVPFQGLLYGDPLTRPFAHLPMVTVPDAPSMPVSGVIQLTALASTTHPTAAIAGFRLYVDGVPVASQTGGGPVTFDVDTAQLGDGVHEIVVTAHDGSAVRSEGRWLGQLVSTNHGDAVSVTSDLAAGDLSTSFQIAAVASGAPMELRLYANGRLIAAASAVASTSWTIRGQEFGAGPVTLRVAAEYSTGPAAISAPLDLAIAFANPPAGTAGSSAPIAYSYHCNFATDGPLLIELPATDADGSALTYSILAAPTSCTVSGAPPVLLVSPTATGLCGDDSLVFQASDGMQTSAPATVTLRYVVRPFLRADVNDDDVVDVADAIGMLSYLFGGTTLGSPAGADMNGDGLTNIGDPIYLLGFLFGAGPPPPPPFPSAACL
ncbi:MAG: Ig-like domain-containing protein [Planctomycetota bacterium]